MTDEDLAIQLKKVNISRATILIPNKAVYVKNARFMSNNHMFIRKANDVQVHFDMTTNPLYVRNPYVILLENGQRVGGIFIMGDVDLHVHIFEEFRGSHYLSDFMKSGWLKQLRPTLTSITCVHDISTPEYETVKHLADLAHLAIREY